MARGSRPMMRAARPVEMGWSLASRIGARSGISRVRSRCSPRPSSGWMVEGDQSTSHSPPSFGEGERAVVVPAAEPGQLEGGVVAGDCRCRRPGRPSRARRWPRRPRGCRPPPGACRRTRRAGRPPGRPWRPSRRRTSRPGRPGRRRRGVGRVLPHEHEDAVHRGPHEDHTDQQRQAGDARHRAHVSSPPWPGRSGRGPGPGEADDARPAPAPGRPATAAGPAHQAAVGRSARANPARSYSPITTTSAVMCQQNTGMRQPVGGDDRPPRRPPGQPAARGRGGPAAPGRAGTPPGPRCRPWWGTCCDGLAPDGDHRPRVGAEPWSGRRGRPARRRPAPRPGGGRRPPACRPARSSRAGGTTATQRRAGQAGDRAARPRGRGARRRRRRCPRPAPPGPAPVGGVEPGRDRHGQRPPRRTRRGTTGARRRPAPSRAPLRPPPARTARSTASPAPQPRRPAAPRAGAGGPAGSGRRRRRRGSVACQPARLA